MRTFGWVEIHAADHCNNNCRSCHNYSPFSPKKTYEAEEYYPWLDTLIRGQACFQSISIMGGEPFLHPDIIKFTYGIRKRYKTMLVLTTNGFWLSERDINYFDPLWKMLTTLKVSIYPNVVKQLGGIARMNELLEYLRNRHPHLRVDLPGKYEFNKLYFTDEPMEITKYCANSQCTALLTDGRMLRCGPAYHHLAPGQVTDAFRNSEGLIYDLNEFEFESFWYWRMRYPFEACSYCSLARRELTNWKVEPGTGKHRREYEEDYHLSVVQGYVNRGELNEAIAKGLDTVSKTGESSKAFTYLAQLYDMAGKELEARLYAARSQELELASG